MKRWIAAAGAVLSAAAAVPLAACASSPPDRNTATLDAPHPATLAVNERPSATLDVLTGTAALKIGAADLGAGGAALAEEPFPVGGGGGRHRPDAAARAVPREPEHRRVPGVDGPHERLVVRRRGPWLEETERRILAEVPEGEGPLSRMRRRGLPGEQVLGVAVCEV